MTQFSEEITNNVTAHLLSHVAVECSAQKTFDNTQSQLKSHFGWTCRLCAVGRANKVRMCAKAQNHMSVSRHLHRFTDVDL